MMDVACSGNVLLVGDGDFSFSLSLLKHGALLPAQVTASNLETPETIQQHKLAKSNMAELESIGACVLLEVDACELHTHPTVSKKIYSRIIFNFPLADRHNIKKNRALLADFFSSSSYVLAPGGQVMLTLCKGQGGTPADQPQRSWHDSWQALAMAANAGFVLAKIFPFDMAQFPEYHSVGFRFQDKSFDTGGSLVHVFEKTDIVSVPESIVARGALQHNGAMYSCSHYIAEKLKRNLLEEEGSPMKWLKQELELMLTQCLSSTALTCGFAETVLPGHKSRVSLSSDSEESQHNTKELDSHSQTVNTDQCLRDGDALTETKRQKDEDNLTRKKVLAASSFAHGVDNGEEARSRNSVNSLSFLKECIPDNDESVYILIKGFPKSGSEEDSESQESNSGDASSHEVSKGSEHGMDCHDKVFHYRTSLLENLTNVCSAINNSARVNTSTEAQNGSYTSPLDKVSVGKSVTATGNCCAPLSIQPHCLPIHHELLFVHKLLDCSEDPQPSMNDAESPQCQNQNPDFESMSNRFLSCLQNFTVFRDNSQLDVQSCQNSKVKLEGMRGVKCVKLICRKDHHGDSFSQPIGIILKVVTIESHQFFVSVLHLDSIVCHTENIPDPRLLWSCSERVLDQLAKFEPAPVLTSKEPSASTAAPVSPHYHYQLLSLYPMKFAHDLSFWENNDSGASFDEAELFEVIRYIAHDSVVKVSLVDRYTEPVTCRTSRCYRLHFQSHSLAFPYAVSWKLQSLIRMEVSRRLGVTLR